VAGTYGGKYFKSGRLLLLLIFLSHVQIYLYYVLSRTVVLVLGCNWLFLAVVKHVNN
jgi:hypothetical protein